VIIADLRERAGAGEHMRQAFEILQHSAVAGGVMIAQVPCVT